jgi:hypothetical protein
LLTFVPSHSFEAAMAGDGGDDRVFDRSEPPDSYTAFVHDAVVLFATAADRLIKDTGQDWFEGDSVPALTLINAYLRSVHVEGKSGAFQLDNKGERNMKIDIAYVTVDATKAVSLVTMGEYDPVEEQSKWEEGDKVWPGGVVGGGVPGAASPVIDAGAETGGGSGAGVIVGGVLGVLLLLGFAFKMSRGRADAAPLKAPPVVPAPAVAAPAKAPAEAPVKALVKAPAGAPVKAPAKAPAKAPGKAPEEVPAEAPVKAPRASQAEVLALYSLAAREGNNSAPNMIHPNNLLAEKDLKLEKRLVASTGKAKSLKKEVVVLGQGAFGKVFAGTYVRERMRREDPLLLLPWRLDLTLNCTARSLARRYHGTNVAIKVRRVQLQDVLLFCL